MEALASPLSLLIKTAPGNGAQGDAPGNSGQAGEIPQDLFAALLSRQLGAALPGHGQLPLQLPQQILPASDADADPAELTADQLLLPEQAAVPLTAPILPPPVAAAVAQAPARSEDIAVVGSAISAAVGQGQTAGDVGLVGLGKVTAEPAPRQAIAAEPASFAAAVGAAQADERATVRMRGVDLAVGLPPVAPPMDEVPQPSAATTFALPATAARSEAPAHASSSIAQPVTSDIWGEKLGERVVWMVSQQHQGVELHLNPPALGPLEVRLSMNDNQASLTFSTQHAPVREAIEGATSRLREMLAESGISLGSVSVNVGNFSQQQSDNQALADNRGQPQISRNGTFSVEQPLPAPLVVPLRHIGMVDIFA